MPQFTTSQGQVHYQIQGSGTPLVLLHPDRSSSVEFDPLIPQLSDNFQVLSVDNPGCGRSQARAFSYDYYKENAKAVADVIKGVVGQSAWLIGVGGGALTALWVAILAPSRVSGVIADSFTEFVDPGDLHKDIAARSKPTEEMKSFWSQMNGPGWPAIVEQLDRILANIAEQQRSLFNWRLEEVSCPVLITGSKEDHLLSDLGPRLEKIAEQVAESRLRLYSSGQHPSFWSQSEKFWKDAAAFIEAHKLNG